MKYLLEDVFGIEWVYLQISISVEDLNDCSPYFNPEAYSMSVYENSKDGNIVGQVTGLDDDVSGMTMVHSVRKKWQQFFCGLEREKISGHFPDGN